MSGHATNTAAGVSASSNGTNVVSSLPHPLVQSLRSRGAVTDKHKQAELHNHVGVKFNALSGSASASNLPYLSHTANSTGPLTIHSHSQTSLLLGFGSSSPTRSLLASAAIQQQQLHHAGALTERRNKTSSHQAPLQHPLPSLSGSLSAREHSVHHFPSANLIGASTPQPPGLQPTHPRLQKLLLEAERERQQNAEQRQMQEDESKMDHSSSSGNILSPRDRKVLISNSTKSLLNSASAAKLDLSNVEHFDAIQTQISQMFDALLAEHSTALMRRFAVDLNRASNRVESSHADLEKQHQATLQALSLAHSTRAAKLLTEFKQAYAARWSDGVEESRLRALEQAVPMMENNLKAERENWQQARNDWSNTYDKLAHKYHALLHHTTQISRVLKQQRDITLELEKQLLQAGLNPSTNVGADSTEGGGDAHVAHQFDGSESELNYGDGTPSALPVSGITFSANMPLSTSTSNASLNPSLSTSTLSSSTAQLHLPSQQTQSVSGTSGTEEKSAHHGTVQSYHEQLAAVSAGQAIASSPTQLQQNNNANVQAAGDLTISHPSIIDSSVGGPNSPPAVISPSVTSDAPGASSSAISPSTQQGDVITDPTQNKTKATSRKPSRDITAVSSSSQPPSPRTAEGQLLATAKSPLSPQNANVAPGNEHKSPSMSRSPSTASMTIIVQEASPVAAQWPSPAGTSSAAGAIVAAAAAAAPAPAATYAQPEKGSLTTHREHARISSITMPLNASQQPKVDDGVQTPPQWKFNLSLQYASMVAYEPQEDEAIEMKRSESEGADEPEDDVEVALQIARQRSLARRASDPTLPTSPSGDSAHLKSALKVIMSSGAKQEFGFPDDGSSQPAPEKPEDRLHRRMISFEMDSRDQDSGAPPSVTKQKSSARSSAKDGSSYTRIMRMKSATGVNGSSKQGENGGGKDTTTSSTAKRRGVKLSKRSSMPIGVDAQTIMDGTTASGHKDKEDGTGPRSPRARMNRRRTKEGPNSVNSPTSPVLSAHSQDSAGSPQAISPRSGSSVLPPSISRSMSMPFSLPPDVMNLLNVNAKGAAAPLPKDKDKDDPRSLSRVGSVQSITSRRSNSYAFRSGSSTDEISYAPEDTLDDPGFRANTPPSPQGESYAGESVEVVSERWKARLLKLRVALSRAQGKNEALCSLLQQSNDRVGALSTALENSKLRTSKLQDEISAATRNSAELLMQLKAQTSTRRKDLLSKINEQEAEITTLKEELLILREEQIEYKKQSFTINALRNDVVLQSKKAERASLAAERWKTQMEQSLQLVSQVQAELVASKEDHHANLRKMKKRLVLKSIWFRTQLIKLERLQELCMGLDHYLRPELTCPSCLDLFKYPQSLSPCGHSMCANCVNALKHDGSSSLKAGHIICHECKRECESVAPNFILEGVLSRYHWWTMLLKDFYSSKQLTLKQEQDLKYMQVKSQGAGGSSTQESK